MFLWLCHIFFSRMAFKAFEASSHIYVPASDPSMWSARKKAAFTADAARGKPITFAVAVCERIFKSLHQRFDSGETHVYTGTKDGRNRRVKRLPSRKIIVSEPGDCREVVCLTKEMLLNITPTSKLMKDKQDDVKRGGDGSLEWVYTPDGKPGGYKVGGKIHPQSALLRTTKDCFTCGTKSKTMCARCMLVFYCSKACQVADYKNHKTMCTPNRDLADDPTPKYGIIYTFSHRDQIIVDDLGPATGADGKVTPCPYQPATLELKAGERLDKKEFVRWLLQTMVMNDDGQDELSSLEKISVRYRGTDATKVDPHQAILGPIDGRFFFGDHDAPSYTDAILAKVLGLVD
jgi:MYND finger